MILAEDKIKKIRDGDWVCSDPLCGNVNYKWRKCCNECLKDRDEPVPPLVKVIGEDAAGKSAGVFKALDWQCRCGNVNWARRQKCNRCERSKFDPVNMLSPEEIMRDEEDDNVSVHSSLSSPNIDSDETDDSGVVACGTMTGRRIEAMKYFVEKLVTGVLGYSQEDFLNRSISLDLKKASTAMYYIVQHAVIVPGVEPGAGLPDLQATDEAAKSFLMNCDLLSPEQKNILSEMSASRIREKYLEMTHKIVEQVTGIPSSLPQMNPQNVFNQPPPLAPALGVPPVSASISATYMASQIQAPYPMQGQMQAPFQMSGQIQAPFQMPGQMQALTLSPQQIQAPFQMQAPFPNLPQIQAPFPNQSQMPTSASDPTQMQAPVLVPVATSTPVHPGGPMQPPEQTPPVSTRAQVQGSLQVTPPNSEHHCHGTDSVSRDMKCCDRSSSTTCDSQHFCTKSGCTERCCSRKPVGCCNQHHFDNSKYETHSCGNGPSMCCDRNHHDSRSAPHVTHHEKERSHSGGSPNAPSTEERRIIMKTNSKDRREEFYARRSPSPPPVYRRRHSPPDRHGMRYSAYHTAPRRDNSPRDRDRHSRRRYSPDERYGRRN